MSESTGLEIDVGEGALSDDPQAAVERLRGDLARAQSQHQAESEARRAAEARAMASDGRVRAVEQDRAALEFSTVSSALDAATQQASSIKRDLANAMQEAEYTKVADLQEQLGRVAATIVQLESGKAEMERRAAMPPQQQQQQPRQPAGDPIQADLQGRTPRTRAWLEQHKDATGVPRYYTDPKFQRRVIRSHEDAVDAGHAIDTDGYFDFINRSLGIVTENAAAGSRGSGPDHGRTIPSAAPVRTTADYGDGQQQRGGSEHIPQAMADYARKIGVDPVSYYKEWKELGRTNGFKISDPWRGYR